MKFNKQYGKAMGCLLSYLGRQCQGFGGSGMGRSKDETLEKQERKNIKTEDSSISLVGFERVFAM